ncbi:Ig-like domain-containing protein [Paenibacillus whitsoniae]|uniref:Tandem-95 repeat protein n=1 Tax=Paenibacillus whitsoniae TaxID=2496558 RepID=A0A3S0ABF5_9BACL|nr:Ig-like domain-containing protein [Paenibacillus whitsoniae]RTE09080.1 tandem-95 repeat protein [Paenibacillus whitsoniae]
MRHNGIKRLISAGLALLLVVGAIGFSPASVAAAAAPTSTTANYKQFQVKLTADPVTDAAPVGSPSGFGTTGSAGRIWTDKSVTAESDGSFGVKLSTLAQEYVTVNSQNPGVGGGSGNTPAADVTFILDMSLSMGSSGNDIAKPGGGTYYRVQAMALAANEAIRTVMNANPNNRVAVYWFGGGATTNHLGTMLDLGHYEFTSGHESEDYLKYSNYTITPNSNLRRDGSSISAAQVSLGAGTPTQDGIMYGISKTIKDLGTREDGPRRQPYVFILSDGAAVNAKKAWYTSPKGKSFESDYNNALTDAITIANYNRPSSSDNNYVPASGSASTTTGTDEIAALTTLTGAYMKKLIGEKYTAYNGESTESKFYTVGLGSSAAINGPSGSSPVYAWAGLDPKTLYDNRTNSSFRDGSAVATYNKLTGFAVSGPGGIDYANTFVYSNYYTFASSYDLLSGAFNGMASDVEASTTILPLLDIPAGGGLGGSSETAEIKSAIVFVDEIGQGLTVDTSTLKIGDAVAAVDTSLSITGGTAYKFAGYGSKAVIQTVDGVTSLTWYIDSSDMQPHIYRFTNRTSPVAGEYTAPTNGSFALNYKVKPAFAALPDDSGLNLAYYLNSGSAAGGAKTAAYFTPPADSPYYQTLNSPQTVSKSGGIGAAYVTEESLSGGKMTMKLGNNGKLDLEMGIVKAGPATAQLNGTINYTVTVYNYTDTPKTGLSVISEGQTQSGITVPANGSKEMTFNATAPGTTGQITSGAAVISGINLASNTVTTDVTNVNAPPTAAAQSVDVNQNTAKAITLSVTDDLTAVNDLIYTVPATTAPAHGTLSQDTVDKNKWTYTPTTGYSGPDSFTYKVTDAGGLSSSEATITITVNGAPTAADQTVQVVKDTPKVITLGVTDDLTAVNNLIYTVPATTAPLHGTLTQDATNKNKWTYTPSAGYTGSDSFTYKVTDEGNLSSSEATVTIIVNGPPVAVGQDVKTNKDVAKPIMLIGMDDLSSVTGVVYHVPSTTLQGGTLTQVGTSGAVIYTPAPGYIGPDSFTFTITDEGGLVSNPAVVNLTVNGSPTASGNTFETSENVSLTEQVVGTDPNGDALSYHIDTQAGHGTVTMDTYGGGAFTYVPTADYAGEDSFTFKVMDEDGLESEPVTVAITILKSLDGWVGNNGLGVLNPPVIVGAGDPLKLSAISSIFATSAKATITYKILNAANMLVDQIDTVDLAVNPVGTTLVGTQWTNVNYRLNDKAVTGFYTVTYATYKQGNPFQTEPSDRLADNHFSVVTNINLVGTVQRDGEAGPNLPLAGAKVTLYDPTGLNKVAETTTDANGGYSFEDIATKNYLIEVGKQGYTSKKRVFNALPTTTGQTEVRQDFLLVNFGLGLTATPTAIVGDGNTTSVLKTVITDRNGNPIPNIEVVFGALVGTFPGGSTAVTNANGVASVVFKSAKIEGILSQLVPVTATVNDDANGLHDTAQILITFEPASVVGQVTNTTNGHAGSNVLAGVPIKLTADFDGDGIIDFSAETVTDSDGKYSIAVPRGDKPYHLEVIRTENIGGVATPVSYQQTANVGIVTGAGNESFNSEKTATGIVLFKQQDGTEEGKSSLPSSDLKNSMKVYVKKTDGTYIEDSPGHPKSFALANQGVFNVEGLSVNEAYTLDFAYEVSPGKEIVLSHRTVQVSADGEMNITQELIDPYGKVTDAVTNSPIAGAHVVLYYAGTTTGVVLPGIAGFAPNNNASPDQYTDASGDYAYMVFPDTDYKLVVSKEGYNTKTIDNIHVGKDIVKQDFTLDPIPPSNGTPSVPTPTNVTLNLSVDKNLVQEGGNSTISVDYTNPTATTIKDGKITVTVPDGAKIVDADGGTVDGNTITWPITDLPVGQAGSHHVVVKWPQLSTKDADFDLQGKFTVGVNAVKASSTVRVKVFSDRYNHLQHQHYILGYPDGTFKTNNALTRAELAAIVARLTENVKIEAPLTFRDVSETHWAANYIKIVTKHGFFNGFEDGTFHPEAPVTRAELASVMVRFLKLNVGVTGDYHFTDVQGHWAAQSIEELYREKFLAGYPDGTFKPAANITRVEAVTLINRMLYRGPLTGISPLFPDVSSTYWGFGDIMEASVSHESTRNADGSEAWLNKIADDVQ